MRVPSFTAPTTADDPLFAAQIWSTHGSLFTDTASCMMDNGRIHAQDPVWGAYSFKHPVFYELALSMAFRRLQCIEQLTLPPLNATIPNTAYMPRWEHIWGCAIMAFKLAKLAGFHDEYATKCALRTLLADVPHTAFSHLGDHLKQGAQGGENYHDLTAVEYLERSGVSAILRRHGFDPSDLVISPHDNDWVECGAPRLCVDRADYGLREMRRWMPNITLLDMSVGSFAVHENQLVMTSLDEAKVFARGYLMLSQEHWSEVTHRLIEALFLERIKRTFVLGLGWDETWLQYHPYDLMYCSDPQELMNMETRDGMGGILDEIMRGLAHYERTYGWKKRCSRVADYLTDKDLTSRDPYCLHHPSVEIRPMEATDREGMYVTARGLKVVLPPFKTRQIDPPVLIGGHSAPLSEIDAPFRGLLARHAELMAEGHVATVLLNAESSRMLDKGLRENANVWPVLMRRPFMDEAALTLHIKMAGAFAASYTRLNYTPD